MVSAFRISQQGLKLTDCARVEQSPEKPSEQSVRSLEPGRGRAGNGEPA